MNGSIDFDVQVRRSGGRGRHDHDWSPVLNLVLLPCQFRGVTGGSAVIPTAGLSRVGFNNPATSSCDP